MVDVGFPAVFDALECGVYVVNPLGGIVMFNARAEEILGWRRQEVISPSQSRCFCCAKGERGVDNGLDAGCLHDGNAGVDAGPFVRHLLTRGRTRVAVGVRVRWTPAGNGEAFRVISFWKVLSEEGEALMRQTREVAEEANRQKDKFVSLVAHDLRAPLSSMVGLMEFLLDDPEGSLQPSQHDLVNDMMATGRSLIELIEGVLNIGRLKSGKIIPDKTFFDLQFFTESVIQRVIHLAREKQITLENHIPTDVRIYADMSLFAAVVQNLLTNAIKFSRPGDVISIRQPLSEGGTAVEVCDQGVGIPADVLPKLFNVSEKTTTPGTAGETGTGFGLPFSFDIMEAHGGSLTVQSEAGRGSVFCARLPQVKPRVMLVDDEAMDRFMVRSVLNQMDLEVLEMESGGEALARMEREVPHLILSDVNMPDMDGMELLRRLKQDDATRKIPVILITGDDKTETRDLAFRLGADDFVEKPIILHDFLPRIRHHLGG
ncbi:MAG: response regulator [Magnetococcales bacterium]|nr:response regulator [Magnetococcales bacterium]